MKKNKENITEFQFAYKQEVTEKRKQALQNRLAKLKTTEEKILFLRDEKAKYLQNISAQTLEVSGSVHAKFAPNAELFFDRYIQIEIHKLEKSKHKTSKKEGVLLAPVVKLFCALVHQSNINIRGEESAEDFCKSVCKQFNLPYPLNTRKYFNQEADIKAKDKNLKKVKELILPQIPEKERIIIEEYINSKIKMFN